MLFRLHLQMEVVVLFQQPVSAAFLCSVVVAALVPRHSCSCRRNLTLEYRLLVEEVVLRSRSVHVQIVDLFQRDYLY